MRRTDWHAGIIHQAVYLLDHYLAQSGDMIREHQLMEVGIACLMVSNLWKFEEFIAQIR